jgi:hypothetical protein
MKAFWIVYFALAIPLGIYVWHHVKYHAGAWLTKKLGLDEKDIEWSDFK